MTEDRAKELMRTHGWHDFDDAVELVITAYNAGAQEAREELTQPDEDGSVLVDVLEAMRKLALRSHYYCEDPWYSCPKAEDGCANEARGDECDCGADKHNAEVARVFMEAMRLAGSLG